MDPVVIQCSEMLPKTSYYSFGRHYDPDNAASNHELSVKAAFYPLKCYRLFEMLIGKRESSVVTGMWRILDIFALSAL